MKIQMRCLEIAAVCLSLFAFASANCGASDFYVKPDGNDSANGTSLATAWKSIDRGDVLGLTMPGDTIHVMAGNYAYTDPNPGVNWGSPVFISRGGEDGSPITYKAEGNVIVSSTGGDDYDSVIGIQASYIVLDGFTLQGSWCNTVCPSGLSGLEVRNCRMLQGSVYAGICFNSPALIHHNLFLGDYGFMPRGGAVGSVLYNNTFANNRYSAIDYWQPYNGTLTLKNNVFVSNSAYIAINLPNATLVNSNNTFFNYTAGVYFVGGVKQYAPTGPNEDTVDPILATDYSLCAGSPCVDTGVDVGLSYLGPHPDRGAFESPEIPANAGTISGDVTDSATTAGIPNAQVSITLGGTSYSAKTNGSGHYSIQASPVMQTVKAFATGYKADQKSVTVPSNGSVTANFALVAGVDYYVKTDGNDFADGLSIATAWKSIDRGDVLGQVGAGDTIHVMAGNYALTDPNPGGTQGWAVALNHGGTSGKPITYRAEGDVTVSSNGADNYDYIIGLGASNIVLDGFTLVGSWAEIGAVGGLSGLEIKNCRMLHSGATYGMVMNSPALIHHCLFTGEYGWVPRSGAVGTILYNNTFAYCRYSAIDYWTAYNGTLTLKNNIFVNGNSIYNAINLPGAILVHSNNTFFNYWNGLYYENGDLVFPPPTGVDEDEYDPMLAPDYSLCVGSPSIDTGVDVGLPYLGLYPDRGAFESPEAPANAGTISGVVTDSLTSLAVPNAFISVTLGGTSFSAKTDSYGFYSISADPGTQTISVSSPHYWTQQLSVNVPASGSISVDVSLVPVTDYYVKPDGNDDNDGTSITTAWKTIDRGDVLGSLGPGDTVHVMAGNYDYTDTNPGNNFGWSVVFGNCAGTAGNPITYKADGNVTITSNGGDVRDAIFSITRSYIVLDGFTLQGDWSNIQVSGGGYEGLEIKNCRFLPAANSRAIWANSPIKAHHNLLDGQTIVIGDGATGSIFDNNTWVGNSDNAVVVNGGMQVTGTVTIKNNIVTDCSGVVFDLPDATLANSNNTFFNCPSGLYYVGGVLTSTPTGSEENILDPVLGLDYHLLAGSPCIDSGVNVGLPYLGPAPDRGAFETQAVPEDAGTISGDITDSVTAMPIPGALVTVTMGGAPWKAKANASGHYSVSADAGTQTVSASAVGYAGGSASVSVPANGSVTANLSLVPNVTPTTVDKVGYLRGLMNQAVYLTTSVVTAGTGAFINNMLYVEDEGRAAGIRVVSSPTLLVVAEGDRIAVQGTVSTSTLLGWSSLNASSIKVLGSGPKLGPLGTPGKSIAGQGLQDAWLLVRAWGKVTILPGNTDYFLIDDGSGRSDGSGHPGIPVIVSSTLGGVGTLPADGSYATITGIAGYEDVGGGTAVPVIRPRGAGDMH